MASLSIWALAVWVRMFKLPWLKSVVLVILLGGPYLAFALAAGLSDRVSYFGIAASIDDLIKAFGA
jgi:hypothetical protein